MKCMYCILKKWYSFENVDVSTCSEDNRICRGLVKKIICRQDKIEYCAGAEHYCYKLSFEEDKKLIGVLVIVHPYSKKDESWKKPPPGQLFLEEIVDDEDMPSLFVNGYLRKRTEDGNEIWVDFSKRNNCWVSAMFYY